jgi:rsbT co-antagonist protein RsbR
MSAGDTAPRSRPSAAEEVATRDRLEMTTQLVCELERLSCEQEARTEAVLADLTGRTGVLGAMVDAIPDPVAVIDDSGMFTHLNQAAETLLGPARELGALHAWRSVDWIYRADGVTRLPPDEMPVARALRGEVVDGVEMYLAPPELPQGMWLLVSVRPIRVEGAARGAVLILRDVTDRKLREREMEQQLAREKERNDLLERMREAIQQLSTPVLEVWDDVLAVPIVGVVDSMRAAEMMDRVLAAVENSQCRYLILDITGIDAVDTATADRFAKLVTAVEILGAQCFLTGARAQVAQAMASLGIELGRLTTFRTLKHALAECMRLTAAAAARPRLDEIFNSKRARP